MMKATKKRTHEQKTFTAKHSVMLIDHLNFQVQAIFSGLSTNISTWRKYFPGVLHWRCWYKRFGIIVWEVQALSNDVALTNDKDKREQ